MNQIWSLKALLPVFVLGMMGNILMSAKVDFLQMERLDLESPTNLEPFILPSNGTSLLSLLETNNSMVDPSIMVGNRTSFNLNIANHNENIPQNNTTNKHSRYYRRMLFLHVGKTVNGILNLLMPLPFSVAHPFLCF